METEYYEDAGQDYEYYGNHGHSTYCKDCGEMTWTWLCSKQDCDEQEEPDQCITCNPHKYDWKDLPIVGPDDLPF